MKTYFVRLNIISQSPASFDRTIWSEDPILCDFALFLIMPCSACSGMISGYTFLRHLVQIITAALESNQHKLRAIRAPVSTRLIPED